MDRRLGIAALLLALLLAAVHEGPHAPALPAAEATRIRPDTALDHESRARLVAILRERGPQRLQDLARALALDRTTVEHHVRMLERARLAAAWRTQIAVLVHLPGQEPPTLERPPTPAERRIVDALRQRPEGMRMQDLQTATAEIPRRTRGQALLRLQERDVVRREWRGRNEIVRLKDP